MKKLKSKIFWTICIMLSLFFTIILFIFNYQDYNRTKREIEQNLFRMNNDRNKEPLKEDNKLLLKPNNNKDILIEENNPKLFMDATIYTILLNDNNEIIDIISHTEDGTINNNVKETASKIILSNRNSITYIGNLYFETYSYNYNANNYIILIDNTEICERLKNSLQLSIILFIVCEMIIVVISKILSKWIIRPVEESFNKQKQFIADASHELKTPLSVIMASAEALEFYPKEQKWIDNIKSESGRMSNLITNLLDLAKLESGNRTKQYEIINLSLLVEKAILTFEGLAYEKNIQLDYQIKDNISFKCNNEEIKQLLSILLDNAIKHSYKNEKIIVNLKTEKNNIILEVINKGIPIPKKEEEKIFERFYRVDKSRNREDNRYGLGLAIAKRIVINYKGKIFAHSDNKYTTFKVVLKK